MVIITSFDVGIKNLGVCKIEYTNDNSVTEYGITCNILFWDVLNIGEESEISESNYAIHLVECLDKYPELTDTDIVLIEKQPFFNPKMRSLSNVIQTYFIIRGIKDAQRIQKVLFFLPKNKLQVYQGPRIECNLKTKYSRTKRIGIEQCKCLISHNTEYTERFMKFKKKDDAADSLLQALCYVKFELEKVTSQQSNKKIESVIFGVSRKPTEKQQRGRYYTSANIRYFIQQYKKENPENYKDIVKKNDKIKRSIEKMFPFESNSFEQFVNKL